MASPYGIPYRIVEIVIKTEDGDKVILGESKRERLEHFLNSQLAPAMERRTETAEQHPELKTIGIKDHKRTRGYKKLMGSRHWSYEDEGLVFKTLSAIPRLVMGKPNPAWKEAILMLSNKLKRTRSAIYGRFSIISKSQMVDNSGPPYKAPGMPATFNE